MTCTRACLEARSWNMLRLSSSQASYLCLIELSLGSPSCTPIITKVYFRSLSTQFGYPSWDLA